MLQEFIHFCCQNSSIAPCQSHSNLLKLIRVLRDIPDSERGAQFRCVLLVVGPNGEEHVFEGACGGRLLQEPKGGAGFGYDPLFVPNGHKQTFAELGDDVKNALSHRAHAWARMAEWLRSRN